MTLVAKFQVDLSPHSILIFYQIIRNCININLVKFLIGGMKMKVKVVQIAIGSTNESILFLNTLY